MSVETEREEVIFDAAIRLNDPKERETFLARACAGNKRLRGRIDGLLTVQADAENFFLVAKPSLNVASLPFSPDNDFSPPHSPGEEPLGSRIGRYKLIEKIGEGGCGVVYMAEQEEPVRRRVALKIIKLGMETKSVIARFEAERQALAMMDHPHIARVFDAGATDRGPPYFVMELVRGVKITEYCDLHRLTIRQRLDLFIQICQAIQHAHQKGIIHGDIKPSNVMVTSQDDVPVPKVIDFGISKATEARLTDKLLFTTYAQFVGTPAYMSPEQAEMGGVDIDTRSDIYSLGVLLYELLTGATPFNPKELLKSGLDEMRRTLREREPARPSLRLTQLKREDLIKTAGSRAADPARLTALLRGDLDWIVMKALEKDRRRRYETANGLGLDIYRHLQNEPVAACPPSWVYRLRKLVRRNRVTFVAGGAVTLALVVGTGTSTWLFLKEREARQRAVSAEQQQAKLRHDAEIREKTTQAALFVSQERFEDADLLLKEIPSNKATVEGAAVFRAMGEWHALENRPKRAAECISRLLVLDQLDGFDAVTLDYLRAGPLLIWAGKTDGYDRFREEGIAWYARTTNPFADRILKISLLVPANDRILGELLPVADATKKAFEDAAHADDAFQAAWRAVSLALWHYRRGQYNDAIVWSQRCLGFPEPNAPRTATARSILAMAYHATGREQAALTELAASREIVETKFKNEFTRGTPVQGFWFDFAFARIIYREMIDQVGLNGSPRD